MSKKTFIDSVCSTKPRLSFCIPTRNRANEIISCLQSIIDQATDEVDIVVVDGASTDNTKDVVNELSAEFPRLTYFRRDECVGVDKDVLKAVALAQGDYCWLMSDDDRLEPGAVKYVLERIAEHSPLAGISVNIAAYDRKMRYRIYTFPVASGNRLKKDTLFSAREECFSILGVHFGFLSGQIVNRTLWETTVSREQLDEFCNSWLLVYVIGKMLELKPQWLYVHSRLVAYRSGNDSFAARLGVYNRQVLAHDEYERTLRSLFGCRSDTYKNVLATIISDRIPVNLAVIKANGCPLSMQLNLFWLYRRRYWYFPLFWFKVLPIFFVPNVVLKFIRTIYFLFKASTGASINTRATFH